MGNWSRFLEGAATTMVAIMASVVGYIIWISSSEVKMGALLMFGLLFLIGWAIFLAWPIQKSKLS